MRTFIRVGLAGILVAATPHLAGAGGFQRGQADIDILFEPGAFVTRSGLTYVSPRRGFETINGRAVESGRFAEDVLIPNHAIKFGGDLFACSGAYTESFGGDADYTNLPGGALPAPLGNPFGSRTRAFSFDSDEFSATCRASADFGGHRISVLGGVYAEDFSVDFSSFGSQNVTSLVAAGNPLLASLIRPGTPSPVAGTQFVAPVQVDVDAEGGFQRGWRVGAAYEIPEIALRASVIYRASLTHDDIAGTGAVQGSASSFAVLPNGVPLTLGQFGGLLPVPGVGAALSAALPQTGTALPQQTASLNTVTSPASLNVNLQTGIAEDTLLFGGFRWTDWSSLQSVIVSIGGVPGSLTPFFWRDGYTANIGLGRAFNESVSGAVSFIYDRGVGTGADLSSDAYSVAAGLALRQGIGEVRVGGLVGYLDSACQSIADGALFDATAGGDWVYGGNVSLRLAF